MASNFELERRIRELEAIVAMMRGVEVPKEPEWQKRTRFHEDDFPPTSDGGGGGGTGISNRVWNEVPSGAIDGANDEYTTAAAFQDGNEAVHLNGIRQKSGPGNDYVTSESGGGGSGFDTVTFSLAPTSGDNLLIDYDPD